MRGQNINRLATKLIRYACVGLAAIGLAAQPAQGASVAIELSILMDVSKSVDANEFAVQKQAFVNAFRSSTIHSLIQAAPGGVAVNFIQWSGAAEQRVSVGWMHLTDASSALRFASAIQASERAFAGSSAPGSAIDFAAALFKNNGFESQQEIIHLPGDGSEREGAITVFARDRALLAGIDQINGLPILGENGLLNFYQNSVQGGIGSFTMAASNYDVLSDVVYHKLFVELGGAAAPVPPTVILAGLGFLGIVGMFRRH